LQIPPQRIGLKATTNEGLGFIGRGEGIAAMAVASIERVEPRFPTESGGRLV
jgi:2-C-methyl-D-erythritol 2,4-cyclodiphosphate synthase